MTTKSFDHQLSSGFDAGNHANAYDTTDLDEALAVLSPNRSPAFLAAFVLGFYSSFEQAEVPCTHAQAFAEALASDAGRRCVELGYRDPEFVRTGEPYELGRDV